MQVSGKSLPCTPFTKLTSSSCFTVESLGTGKEDPEAGSKGISLDRKGKTSLSVFHTTHEERRDVYSRSQ
jgi:hypothetical protein